MARKPQARERLLDAFDRLWEQGRDVRLVVVGREGWHVEDLVARLGSHPAAGNETRCAEKAQASGNGGFRDSGGSGCRMEMAAPH